MAQKSSSKHTTTNASHGSSAMAQLMARHQDKIVTLKKGESVKGKITKITNKEIIIDLGAKTAATVLEKDKRIYRSLMSLFNVGDTVEAQILNPESEYGNPVVSLRRYVGDLAWGKLEALQKNKELIEVTITDVAKAGYMVSTDFGVSGFLPHSHTSFSQQDEPTPGKKINVSVLEVNRSDNKIIFSQKTVLSDADFAEVVKHFKVGEKVKVTVANVTSFGLFVSLPPFTTAKKEQIAIEGFIHISEIAWNKVQDLSGKFQSGEEIEASVLRFDSEMKRINLSIKRLTADPFEEIMKAFPIDKKVSGTVTKVEEAGITIALSGEEEDVIEGIIRKEKIAPATTYTVGQSVTVTVSEHDKKRHKIVVTPVLLEKPLMYR